jgi:hypothetical protein
VRDPQKISETLLTLTDADGRIWSVVLLNDGAYGIGCDGKLIPNLHWPSGSETAIDECISHAMRLAGLE